MSSPIASSLSTETSRLDRLAAERAGRSDSAAAPAPNGAFSGLLRAAGVQAGAAPVAPTGGPAVAGTPKADASAAQARAVAAAQALSNPTTLNAGLNPTLAWRSGAPTDLEGRAGLRGASARSGVGDTLPTDAEQAAADQPRSADESNPTDGAAGAAIAPQLAHAMSQPPAPRAPKGAASNPGSHQADEGESHRAVRATSGERGDGASGAATGGSAAAAPNGEAAVTDAQPAGAATGPGTDLEARGRDAGTALGAAATGLESVSEGLDGAPAAGAAGAAGPAGPAASALTPSAEGFAGQLAALMSAQGAGAGLAPQGSAGTAAPAQAWVRSEVGSAGFGDAVMLQVADFSRDGIQEAQLHLNPVELGPIQVRIAVGDGRASIDFGAASQQTRALLESALPALAQALQADGLQLAASQVSEQIRSPDAAANASAPAQPGTLADPSLGGGAGGWGGDRDGQSASGRAGWGQQAEGRGGAGASGQGRYASVTGAASPWAAGTPAATSGGLRALDLYA